MDEDVIWNFIQRHETRTNNDGSNSGSQEDALPGNEEEAMTGNQEEAMTGNFRTPLANEEVQHQGEHHLFELSSGSGRNTSTEDNIWSFIQRHELRVNYDETNSGNQEQSMPHNIQAAPIIDQQNNSIGGSTEPGLSPSIEEDNIWSFIQRHESKTYYGETNSGNQEQSMPSNVHTATCNDQHNDHTEASQEPGTSTSPETQMELQSPGISIGESELDGMDQEPDPSPSFHAQMELVSPRSSDSFQSLELSQSQGMDQDDDFMEDSPEPGPSTSFHTQMEIASSRLGDSHESLDVPQDEGAPPSLATGKEIQIPCNGLTLIAKKVKHMKSSEFNFW